MIPISNLLLYETSPYLLQHANNPVNWYPWGNEAFQKAEAEDKPIFLSIGYSTCHWCHVMAHESFEDPEIADLLNRHFVSIKVDKEERPDVDNIYMAVCQAFTGSGGWPTSIFMTARQKPFFAGTYFPKSTRGRMIGLKELLQIIHQAWTSDRASLLTQSETLMAHIAQQEAAETTADAQILDRAVRDFKQIYDPELGGFGSAPKFPVPHNLLFLLSCSHRRQDVGCRNMAERTLLQMYRGGLFDHIGYGFCRYSTDDKFLVPHFEKMLYDNALLILAYCQAYATTQKPLFLDVARKTAAYLLREMAHPEGAFYSAQDADSDGEEGKYYLFTPSEIINILGAETGRDFNRQYDITEAGNFEGKNIPNLLHSPFASPSFDPLLPKLVQYRKSRSKLHLDDKILTFWNSLTIAALCRLYRCCGEESYLEAAQTADRFLQTYLSENGQLYASFRSGRRGQPAFLDDYAGYLFALLALHGSTLEEEYLERAKQVCQQILSDFPDRNNGGFYFSGTQGEALILRPKETYDGATPSGNGLMAWNLVRLAQLTSDPLYEQQAQRQLDFLAGQAAHAPVGHTMFLLALLDHTDPPPKVTIVLDEHSDGKELPLRLPLDAISILLRRPTPDYPLLEGKTTFYICQGHSCLPPAHDLSSLSS